MAATEGTECRPRRLSKRVTSFVTLKAHKILFRISTNPLLSLWPTTVFNEELGSEDSEASYDRRTEARLRQIYEEADEFQRLTGNLPRLTREELRLFRESRQHLESSEESDTSENPEEFDGSEDSNLSSWDFEKIDLDSGDLLALVNQQLGQEEQQLQQDVNEDSEWMIIWEDEARLAKIKCKVWFTDRHLLKLEWDHQACWPWWKNGYPETLFVRSEESLLRFPVRLKNIWKAIGTYFKWIMCINDWDNKIR